MTKPLMLILLCCFVVPALADDPLDSYDGADDRDDIEEAAPWSEGGYTLPAYPKQENLTELDIGGAPTGFRYYLDRASLAPGKDGVVRYTVVIQSNSGARNVLFEGIRCETVEFRDYAYGRSSGAFRVVRQGRWRPIQKAGQGRFRYDLAKLYLCDGYGLPYQVDTILERLRRENELVGE